MNIVKFILFDLVSYLTQLHCIRISKYKRKEKLVIHMYKIDNFT